MSAIPNEKISVLIIDNDQEICSLIQSALGEDEYTFTEATSGIDALERFDEIEIEPDLVILDAILPGIDGYEVCRKIRRKKPGINIPIIMVTSLDDIASINEAYQAGASTFILKPFNPTILSYQVRFLLKANKTAKDLRETQFLLETAQHIAKLGHWEWNIKTRKIAWSDEICHIAGLPGTEYTVSLSDILSKVHPEDKQRVSSVMKRAIHDRAAYHLEHRLLLPDGSSPTIIQEAVVFEDKNGHPEKMVGTVQDISHRKESEEKIKHLSYYNTVTGLPNRSLLKRLLNKRISENESDHSVGVLTVHLDRFKLVNDSNGHAFAEALLRKVAINLIRSIKNSTHLRKNNIPDNSDHSAQSLSLTITHCEADEFVVVLDKIADIEDAAAIARQVNHDLSEPYTISGNEIRITTSIGISIYPLDAHNTETLLKDSSTATYHAKREGGNCYKFYTSSMNTLASERLTLETSLRKAIAEKQFELYYQPKMSLSTSTMTGVEVLLRWNHPQMGLIPPGDFINVLEETGLIVELGEWIIKTVCLQIKDWQDQGFSVQPVAINLSAVQLRQNNFQLCISQILNETQVAPEMIEFEITESMLMSNMRKSITMLKKLRAQGIQIALDDFGTGYSSLTYLKHFPVNSLKIDRSFLQDVTKDSDNAAIVKGIIALAQSMRLKVVAEGIEQHDQLQFLKTAGCDDGQGYLFAPGQEVGIFTKKFIKKTPDHIFNLTNLA